ncbi:serine protease 30-like [Cherax quadricarinatus]
MDVLPLHLILTLLITSTGGRRADFRHGGFPKFPAASVEVARVRDDLPPLNASPCGRTATPRIVGGAATTYGSHPWQVKIEVYKRGEGFTHHCGGAIISAFHIVTAAHCLQVPGLSRHDYRVKVGDYDLNQWDPAEQMFEIEDWTIHPNFGVGGHYNNDVAVVKVQAQQGKGFQMSRFVTPACLPSHTTPYTTGTKCQVSGWGLTDPENYFSKSQLLHSTEVLLMSERECEQLHGSRGYGSGMICAGYLEGKKDSCNGDSGGPLACNIDGSYILLGVVSWGKNCGKPNQPGVYTHIQYYLDWIQSVIKT